MTAPTYSFLPWLRSGVANSITSADGDAAVKVRATLPIDLTVAGTRLDGSSATQVVHRDVSLVGPGDIVGIDPRAIVKVEPRHWITNFESNYLPYVEFYDEDFPWRYTPAAADEARHRLRPWITLVVLEEDEFEDGQDLRGKPLPFLSLKTGVDPTKIFPRPDELWAWAHVHANVDLAAGGEGMPAVLGTLKQTLARNPDLAYARVLSPRRLEPDTAYHAFLIPSFESGRLAGLGQPIPSTLAATESAWASPHKDFPIYHRWFFRTGAYGDFEYLVRLLQPKPADARVGVRDLDVLHPGSNLPPISTPASLGGILKLGGALQVPFPTMKPADQAEVLRFDRWDQPFPHPFQTALAALVNLADDYARAAAGSANPDGDPDPVVTLPLYGRWPALVDRVLADAGGARLPDTGNWIHRLNLDPRFRVAAGLGTQVVQDNDQKYLAAAWQQVGDVVAANARLAFAQAAVAVGKSLLARHVAALPAERQLLLTAPVHARILGSATTVAAQVRASVVPPAALSGAFRRLTRPGTPLARRLALAPSAAGEIVRGINGGWLHPAPPKVAPTGGITVADAREAIRPEGEPDWAQCLLERYPWLRYLPIVILLIIGLTALIFGPVAALLAIALFAPIMRWLLRLLERWAAAARSEGALREEEQTPASVARIPAVTNFVVTRPGASFTPIQGAADSPEAAAFKAALADVYTFTSFAPAEQPRARLDLRAVTGTILRGIDPAVTVPRRIKQIVHLPAWLVENMVERFTPVMAYPVIDAPMYKPLSDKSAELFLPNINLIPPNSLTLLEPNQRFIEAYMVGLNHELARELLWNEYPTDQRGSYFRQFWDVAVQLPPDPTPADREKLRDLPELHRWPRGSALGSHDHRAAQGAATRLVLVIRGELLKRYPTAVIYAHKAEWTRDAGGQIDPTVDRKLAALTAAEQALPEPPRDKIRAPLFEAKVDPDIYFLGFDLGALEARGGPGSGDAGWFFVIKERPGEPRFGMDEVAGAAPPRTITWDDLAWIKIGTAAGAPIRLSQTVSLDAYDPILDQENVPVPADAQARWSPATNSAELAYILYRVPVLCAVHASRMLP